jgi:hypothetical protein
LWKQVCAERPIIWTKAFFERRPIPATTVSLWKTSTILFQTWPGLRG